MIESLLSAFDAGMKMTIINFLILMGMFLIFFIITAILLKNQYGHRHIGTETFAIFMILTIIIVILYSFVVFPITAKSLAGVLT